MSAAPRKPKTRPAPARQPHSHNVGLNGRDAEVPGHSQYLDCDHLANSVLRYAMRMRRLSQTFEPIIG